MIKHTSLKSQWNLQQRGKLTRAQAIGRGYVETMRKFGFSDEQIKAELQKMREAKEKK